MQTKFSSFFILLIVLFLCRQSKAYGQRELNLTFGAGLPELVNLGLRYQSKQAQVGLSYGLYSSDIFAVSGDFYYHFAGVSQFSKRRPWYARLGLSYLREETSTVIDKYVYLSTRIGRDFNISKRVGIAFDLGAMFQLSYEETRKRPVENSWFTIDFDDLNTVLPSFGLTLFYRFDLNSKEQP